MRTRPILTTLIACLLALALPASAALANSSDDRIVQDCQNSATGALTGTYSKTQLNHALHNLPGDVQEYTGCYDAIRQALLASGGSGGGRTGGAGAGGGNGTGAGGGGGAGGTGGSGAGGPGTAGATPYNPPPPDAAQPVRVAGATVAPGALPQIGKDAHRLPTALLVPLALVALAGLAAATTTIGRRVVAARRP